MYELQVVRTEDCCLRHVWKYIARGIRSHTLSASGFVADDLPIHSFPLLQIILRNIDNSTSTLVLRTAVEAVTSQDRFLVMRGLEIVSKLCQAEGNDETIYKTLNCNVSTDCFVSVL